MSTVYVVHRDSEGNRRSEALELNPALLAILRFRRKNPTGICTVELIEQAPMVGQAFSRWQPPLNQQCAAERSE